VGTSASRPTTDHTANNAEICASDNPLSANSNA